MKIDYIAMQRAFFGKQCMNTSQSSKVSFRLLPNNIKCLMALNTVIS